MREEMITSTSNRQVKRLVRLMKKPKLREEDGIFVTEGLRIFREIPQELVREVYVTERFLLTHADDVKGLAYHVLSEEVFSKIADTKTPQGILCITDQVSSNIEEMFRENGIWILLEDIQDPGNLGTIIRTAEGAGVSGVFLSPGCVDIFSPKVVRSTMGSIFRVPFVKDCDLKEAVHFLKEKNVPVYAAGIRDALLYDEADYQGGAAFLIGNEGNGLREEMFRLADRQVMIPMQGKLESLNAAMAAGILLYEADRQRRTGGRDVSDLGA